MNRAHNMDQSCERSKNDNLYKTDLYELLAPISIKKNTKTNTKHKGVYLRNFGA